MKEDFLHYVWKFQKFCSGGITTTNHEPLHIISEGQHNQNSGPDFLNARLEIDGQVWAGNIEIHIKSSDWYAHGHEKDTAYDNVILHVVWEHDAEIFRKDGSVIPTLVLKRCVSKNTLERYTQLFSRQQKWINCETDFSGVEIFTVENWLERLYVERLEQKEKLILTELTKTNNHWEALLFRLLCKNFGLKVNGDSFLDIARSVDFSVVKKCSQNEFDLESLLMGQGGLLEEEREDVYYSELRNNYKYLKHKFGFNNDSVVAPKYFRLRPPNFPTIRLSQIASLYAENQNLFSAILSANTTSEFYSIFKVSASHYWDTHFNFGVSSITRKKGISKSFVDLLIINTIIPLKFCYSSQMGKDATDEIFTLACGISSEANTIIKNFNSLTPVSKSAFQSQALLQLKNEYCDKNRCLQCAVGNSILNR